MQRKEALVWLFTLLILVTSNLQGQQKTRKKLENLSIPYSAQEFFNRVRQGDAVAVNLFLSSGMNPDIRDQNTGWTALMVAVEQGHIDIVQALLSKGADVNGTTLNGKRALNIAIEKSNAGIGRILLNKGSEINSKDYFGKSVLMYASEQNLSEMIQFLLIEGADINMRDNQGNTALKYAAVKGHINVVKLLLNNNADVNSGNEYNTTVLMYAADKGFAEIVEILLSRGVDVNAGNQDDETALMWAAEKDHLNVVQILLDKGVNVDARNKYGETALIYALKKSQNNIVQIVQTLLSKVNQINIKSRYGQTPLMLAVMRRVPLEILQALIDKGANVNHTDNEGKAALMYAAERGYTDIVLDLITEGAIDSLKDNNGRTALILADENGHEETVDQLLKYSTKNVVKDFWSGSIEDLLGRKKVEIEAEGSGIQNLVLNIRRLISQEINVYIHAGTFFHAIGSAQDMVSRREASITLSKDNWKKTNISVACADISSRIPNTNDNFYISSTYSQAGLRSLMPFLEKANVSFPIEQAAVWIISDNANYDDLGRLVEGIIMGLPGKKRMINAYEAAMAMKIIDDSVINITKKAIWKDRWRIISDLRDDFLITWLKGRSQRY